nr:MAG TPA: hypothetical protein [Caudoviricetes sp.]
MLRICVFQCFNKKEAVSKYFEMAFFVSLKKSDKS